MSIFFKTKFFGILLFLVEKYTGKMVIYIYIYIYIYVEIRDCNGSESRIEIYEKLDKSNT